MRSIAERIPRPLLPCLEATTKGKGTVDGHARLSPGPKRPLRPLAAPRSFGEGKGKGKASRLRPFLVSVDFS